MRIAGEVMTGVGVGDDDVKKSKSEVKVQGKNFLGDGWWEWWGNKWCMNC